MKYKHLLKEPKKFSSHIWFTEDKCRAYLSVRGLSDSITCNQLVKSNLFIMQEYVSRFGYKLDSTSVSHCGVSASCVMLKNNN